MTTQPLCSDCGEALQIGFIPDSTLGPVKQSHWHPGPAVEEKYFSARDKRGVKTDWEQSVPITAYRCPGCGLLKVYAVSDHD